MSVPEIRTIPDIQYATVKKQRKDGQVFSVETEQIHGTKDKLENTIDLSSISNTVNTSFVERQNGTDRHLNARKALKTLEFSKDKDYHVCHSWFCASYYNFCWDHGTLRIETGYREYIHRSPMMVLGVTDHIWLIKDMVSYQVIKDH